MFDRFVAGAQVQHELFEGVDAVVGQAGAVGAVEHEEGVARERDGFGGLYGHGLAGLLAFDAADGVHLQAGAIEFAHGAVLIDGHEHQARCAVADRLFLHADVLGAAVLQGHFGNAVQARGVGVALDVAVAHAGFDVGRGQAQFAVAAGHKRGLVVAVDEDAGGARLARVVDGGVGVVGGGVVLLNGLSNVLHALASAQLQRAGGVADAVAEGVVGDVVGGAVDDFAVVVNGHQVGCVCGGRQIGLAGAVEHEARLAGAHKGGAWGEGVGQVFDLAGQPACGGGALTVWLLQEAVLRQGLRKPQNRQNCDKIFCIIRFNRINIFNACQRHRVSPVVR